MKIKEYAKQWPPNFVGDAGQGIQTSLFDTVISARKADQADDQIELKLRKDNKTYTLLVSMPSSIIDGVVKLIATKLPLSLREIGELNVI